MSSPVAVTFDFAPRIKAARHAAHLSQVELAYRLGVSPRSVQHWEAGTMPQPKHRRLVAAFLAEHEQTA